MAATDDWTRPGWRAEAEAWIGARLEELGLERVGEIDQPHLQWWSTVLRVPTGDGAVLEPWTTVLPRDELVAAADLARRSGTVQRALAWYLASRQMPPDVRAEHSASLPYGLKLYLADAPFGAWEV